MSSARWKAVESYYCTRLGGKRRGADYSDADGGKNDCICAKYSVEIRHRKKVSHADILSQVQKATERAEPGQIPLHIVHTPGTKLDDGLVIMRFGEFVKHFVEARDE